MSCMLSIPIFQIMGKKGALSEDLNKIYDNLINPVILSEGYMKTNLAVSFEALSDISKMIGGIGALFYISYRVWKQYANGESISIFPLLRPFILGLCILFFKQIIITSNAILYPFIKITESINLDNSEVDLDLVKKQEERYKEMKIENGAKDDGKWGGIPGSDLPKEVLRDAQEYGRSKMLTSNVGSPFSYLYYNLNDSAHYALQNEYLKNTDRAHHFKNMREKAKNLEGKEDEKIGLIVIPECDYSDYGWTQVGKNIECFLKNTLKWIVEAILYLVIVFLNIYRLLALSVLFMIGPLAFGISIFDGFKNSLASWITRYVNIYLWLPVANIVSTVLKLIATIINSTYSGNFWYLLLFGILCIFLFFKIPQMTGWIVNPGMEGGGFIDQAAGGATRDMISKVGKTSMKIGGKAGAGAGVMAAKGVQQAGKKIGGAFSKLMGGK